MKFRNELKHYVNYSDYMALKKRLCAVARHDSNAGEDGTYKIRSLYFDNIYDRALKEKIDGINNREKFRIRYYNDDFSFIKLEKKSKINGKCYKKSIIITAEECKKIIQGNIQWMLKDERKLLGELYCKMIIQQLRPKTIIDYRREAYIYEPGNVRVTIDFDIKTGINRTDIFKKNIETINTGVNLMILEVKYDEFIPDIITDVVQIDGRKMTAFSKYAAGRIYG